MPRGKPKDYFKPSEVVDIIKSICEDRGISQKEMDEILDGTGSLFADKKSTRVLEDFLNLQNEGKNFDEIARDLGYKPYELRRALRPNKTIMGKLLNQGIGEVYLLFLKATSKAHEILDWNCGPNDYKALSAQATLITNIWKAVGMQGGNLQISDAAQTTEEVKQEAARMMADPEMKKILGIDDVEPPTDSVN